MREKILSIRVCMLILSMNWLVTYAQEKSLELGNVSVVASRTTNNVDGYSTNLKGANIVKGKTVSDVLSFLPNISREAGKFKLNGLDVSEICIDGVKLVNLSELDNISGDMIDKVNVKLLAGTDQNAAYSGGTINIILRRPQDSGYYGSINTAAEWNRAAGLGDKSVGSMFYYRYKNLSIYDNIEFRHDRAESNSEQWQIGSDLYTYLVATAKSKGMNIRNRISFVQQFGNDMKFGGSYLLTMSRPDINSLTHSNNKCFFIKKDVSSNIHAGTLRFFMPLNNRKSSLTITADYFNRTFDNQQSNYTDDVLDGRMNENNDLNLVKLKTDIKYPNRHGQIWKFGTSLQYITSSYTPSDIVASDHFITSSTSTGTTGFTPIASAEVSGTMGKIMYSLGLNWQKNDIWYEDKTSNVKNHNSQWGINPLVKIMIPLDEEKNNALLLNYKRSLDDIPYSAISSVVSWSDANNYTVGNPNLKAPSLDMLMAGLSLLRNKINVTTLFACSHDKIFWQSFQHKDDTNVFYTMPINISGLSSYGLGVEWMESPFDWWQFKLAGRMEVMRENVVIDNVQYDNNNIRKYFYFNNSLYFPHGWGAMLNVDFEPKYYNLNRIYHAVLNVNGGVYKYFCNDRLYFAIDCSPIGIRRKMDCMVGLNKVTYKNATPVQYVEMTMRWKFSGGKKVKVDVIDGIQNYKEIVDSK